MRANDCCRENLKRTVRYDGFHPILIEFQAEDGECWECPVCKKSWVHICDEAEGCYWVETEDHREMEQARKNREVRA